MPRRNSATGTSTTYAHTIRQKGRRNHYRRGHTLSTYARMEKGKTADRYDRPYLDGTYRKDDES